MYSSDSGWAEADSALLTVLTGLIVPWGSNKFYYFDRISNRYFAKGPAWLYKKMSHTSCDTAVNDDEELINKSKLH